MFGAYGGQMTAVAVDSFSHEGAREQPQAVSFGGKQLYWLSIVYVCTRMCVYVVCVYAVYVYVCLFPTLVSSPCFYLPGVLSALFSRSALVTGA